MVQKPKCHLLSEPYFPGNALIPQSGQPGLKLEDCKSSQLKLSAPVPSAWRSSRGVFHRTVMVVVLFLSGLYLLAQGSATGYLYVYPDDPSAYPDPNGSPGNPTLQALFQQYQVVAYLKSFPNASDPGLDNAYEIHCNTDISALNGALQQTKLFSVIEEAAYYELVNCPTPCNNPLTVNDPNAGYQFDLTQAGCAWTITQGNPDIVVGVADAFFDLNDDDLNDGQIISLWGPNNSTNPHGTLVAGMIVATPNNGTGTAGLAPNIKVAAYSVPTNGPFGNPWPAIWQAYLDGRRIINVSWSGVGGSSAPLTTVQAITEIVNNGTLLVVAAGNGDPGNPTPHDAYADIPGVVMVSSVSSDGGVHQWVDYNEHVDLCAPGNGVGSLVYGVGWGTSYSAPAVCAAAGLILSVNECLTPAEIENILKASACPMIPHPQVDPDWVGAGYLNLYQAVQMAQGRSGLIDQNEPAWEGVTYVSSDLTIGSNVTLTINGEVKFSEGASLIIKPGGRVNLYGTLTNACGGPWAGVVVEGMATESQYTPGMHGRLYVYAEAVIENAINGVQLKDGGIISASNALFRNNGTGILYHPYSNFWPFAGSQFGQPRNHFGGFSNCSFLFDDSFQQAASLNAGIQMEGVRGISIRGCSFINERTIENPSGNNSYGFGIKSTDSRFTVSSLGIGNTYPPTNFDHSEFKGLGYGIYTATAQVPDNNGTPTLYNDDFVDMPYTVQQARFSRCIYGIHNRMVSKGVIVGNIFTMGSLPPVDPGFGNTPYTNAQYGVFIENGANGFELQENQFIKVEDNVPYAYGTYCQNLGWFNNKVRRNIYNNVNFGNLADQDNAVLSNPPRGLYYLCNTNTTQRYDFYVYPGGDIRRNQGLELATGGFQAAGNTFTKLNAPDGDFDNNGTQARYYHSGLAQKPLYHSGLVFSDVNPNACISDYCLPPCKEPAEWPDMKADYYSEKALYQNTLFEMQTAISLGNLVLAEQKSNKAAAHRVVMDNLSGSLSMHLGYDTVAYRLDSVRVWWRNMDSPVSEMVVARDYLAKGQNVRAFEILDSIPLRYDLSGTLLTADLSDFRNIMLIMQGESLASLSQAKVQQLEVYANSDKGISSAWAKNILTVKGYHFPPQPKEPGGSGGRQGEMNDTEPSDEAGYQIWPNPAKDFVQFIRKDDTQPIGLIQIADVSGRIIWQSAPNQDTSRIVWQTHDVHAGIYFYTIYEANGLIHSGRISVIK